MSAHRPTLCSAPPSLLTRHSDVSLTEQLTRHWAHRIRSRLIPAGAKLPSIRASARQYGISPHTVVAAYDQLLAQGLIEAHQQRGFFVRAQRVQHTAQRTKLGDTLPPVAPIDATTLVRSMLQGPGDRQSPGTGVLPADWLNATLLSTALRRVMQGERFAPLALHYGEPAGDRRLREALAAKLLEWGMDTRTEGILTTVGATQALDIVARTLLRPGDAVMVDDPGWAVEFARLSQLGMRLLPVPRGPQGPDIDVMQHWLKTASPRMYLTVSVLHNPTGSILSLHAAYQILKLAEAHDFLIVEDDTYAHLAPTHAPRLAALDGFKRTVYISGFSKILTPAWRVGFVAANAAYIDQFINTKMLTTLSTPALLEQAVADCLEQGQLRRHTQRVIERLDTARSRTVKLAQDAGAKFLYEPQGLFGWVDVGTDTDVLAQRMLDHGWLLAPGSLFYATHRPTTHMRINFASSQDARFWQLLRTV